MKTDAEISDGETLTPSQRRTGLAPIAAMIVLLGFFALHQLTVTGFFTARFGALEMLALYGPILISLTAPMVRAQGGQKNPARPFDAATSLSLALGSLWLAIVFPFNFTHLTDVLPDMIRFVFAWITNDLGLGVLILQVIIGFITTPSTIFKYVSVRRQAGTT